jgi:tripartite-type tricarboxylate transporter receptor subunit TctC
MPLKSIHDCIRAPKKAGALPALAAAIGLVLSAGGAQAQGGDNFYQGRDVRVLIGAGVGGTYGLYAQLVTRHLRKHIPGQPNLILQSMPGAGGNIALNYSYSVAPKDGTMMHVIHSDVLFHTVLTPNVKFNAKDFLYIGRIGDADSFIVSTRGSGVKTLADARAREVTMGATGRTNIFALSSLLMNRIAGTKFKVIAGYKGAADIMIAMERGELDSSGMTVANAIALHGERLKGGELVPVFAVAEKRLADYPNVPNITEFGGEAERTLMDLYVSTVVLGRSLAFPPGVPADRLAIMRNAFTKMMADPEFIAETKKSDVPISKMSGEALEAYVNKVMSRSDEQLAVARKLHQDLISGP